jgi:riboflavin synthase
MFTGLIADVGSVTDVELGAAGASLRIRTRLAGALRDGDSIAVNGVCLTARNVRDGSFQADAMSETLTRSSLGELQAQAPVNLELPVRAGDRLGGHVVQGHIDGTGTISGIREEGFARVLKIEAEARLRRYLVEKGSVAIDGVSLTVSALDEHAFAVSLIPETLRRTNLGGLLEGAVVNIEVDILAKHLERLMQATT